MTVETYVHAKAKRDHIRSGANPVPPVEGSTSSFEKQSISVSSKGAIMSFTVILSMKQALNGTDKSLAKHATIFK